MSGQSTPELPHLSSAFEPEMDSFFDLDQNDFTSSLSPTTTRSQSVATQRGPSTNSSFASQSQQPMSGPSHQYDAYRQQTGLPAGGLASTFAVNQATGMQYTGGSNGFVMPVETLNFPLPSADDFDFNSMSDMDLEAESPADSLPAMFYPGKTQFVNPTALGGEASSSFTPQIQRMYPGMHSQQAQAKAAAQQKQQELARQQQRQRALEGQRPLPTQKPTGKTDPAVDERISRLLQQMRQNSAAAKEDAADSPSVPQVSRMKKDEDDMDEDERLLASEEGKKLSSKERRQLRNKVSARAFRSRRKEYIGQLEGEVAAKVQEANDLRVQNDQLLEENARLTDLTRMLLSSSAFSGFLNELSVNGGSIPSALQKTPAAQQATPQPQPARKDINPHQVSHQLQSQNQDQQVGMVMVPEPSINFSSLDISNISSGWNSGISMDSFQVFAVTELPEGPMIDVAALSGKSSDPSAGEPTTSKLLPSLPSLPTLANRKVEHHEINYEVKLDDSLALFHDTPTTSSVTSQTTLAHKPGQFELAVSSNNAEADAVALEKMCTILDEAYARLTSLIPKA